MVTDIGIARDGTIGRLKRSSDVVFAIGVAVVLTTLIIPLPVSFLDVLLAISMTLSVLTLLTPSTVILSRMSASQNDTSLLTANGWGTSIMNICRMFA